MSTPNTKKAMAESSCSRPDRASRTSPREAEGLRDPDGGVSTADAEREPERDEDDVLDPEEPPDDLRDPEGLVLAIRGNANKRAYECSGIPPCDHPVIGARTTPLSRNYSASVPMMAPSPSTITANSPPLDERINILYSVRNAAVPVPAPVITNISGVLSGNSASTSSSTRSARRSNTPRTKVIPSAVTGVDGPLSVAPS